MAYPNGSLPSGVIPAGTILVADSLSGDFETYQGFRTLVSTFLDTDAADLTSNLLDTLIGIGERRINREIRCREMEKPLYLVSDVAQVPDDYLELKSAYTIYGGRTFKIERTDVDQLQRDYPFPNATIGPGSICGYYGGPLSMARDGDVFLFGPTLLSGMVINGTYYQRFVPLKDRPDNLLDPQSGSYQPLYANHSDLYLYACLRDAETIIGRQSRASNWEATYEQLKAALMMQSQQERFSGGPIRIRAR